MKNSSYNRQAGRQAGRQVGEEDRVKEGGNRQAGRVTNANSSEANRPVG
jgi:hypothetical protein